MFEKVSRECLPAGWYKYAIQPDNWQAAGGLGAEALEVPEVEVFLCEAHKWFDRPLNYLALIPGLQT